MVYVIRTIKCRNGVVEKTKFPVRDITESRTREDRREINRAAKNTGDARRNFARVLNNNFFATDYHMTLSLTDEGLARVAKRADKLEAERIAKGKPALDRKDIMHLAMEREEENLFRRVLRACAAKGIDYVYASAVSDKTDPEDVECSARLHLHVVVNKEIADVVGEKWTHMGEVKKKPLSAHATQNGAPDWTALATYIIGQTRVVEGGKRYTISRTAQKPEHTDRVAVRPDAVLRAPAHTVLLEQGAYVPGRAQYIRYIPFEWMKGEEADAYGVPA